MPLNPWYIGQLSPTWQIPLSNDSSTANLTGIAASAISLTFTNTANHNVITRTNGDGSGGVIAIAQANPAIISYQPCALDVANQGMFHVQVWVTYANGTEPYDAGVWDICPK